jgi:hypothetical protein
MKCVKEYHEHVIFSFNSLFAIASSIQLAEPDYSHLKHTNNWSPGFNKEKIIPLPNNYMQDLNSVNHYTSFHSVWIKTLVFQITFIFSYFLILVIFNF